MRTLIPRLITYTLALTLLLTACSPKPNPAPTEIPRPTLAPQSYTIDNAVVEVMPIYSLSGFTKLKEPNQRYEFPGFIVNFNFPNGINSNEIYSYVQTATEKFEYPPYSLDEQMVSPGNIAKASQSLVQKCIVNHGDPLANYDKTSKINIEFLPTGDGGVATIEVTVENEWVKTMLTGTYSDGTLSCSGEYVQTPKYEIIDYIISEGDNMGWLYEQFADQSKISFDKWCEMIMYISDSTPKGYLKFPQKSSLDDLHPGDMIKLPILK